MSEPTNKAEGQAAIDALMVKARMLIADAETIADKFGIEIPNPLSTLGYTSDVWYSPKGSEGDDWSSSDNWESSTTGGWISSSANC